MLPKFRIDKQPSTKEILSMNINEYFYNLIDHKSYCRSNYDNLYEYYSGNIPGEILNEFKINPYKDYILENLNTHSSDLLIKKLKNEFKDFYIEDQSITSCDKRYIRLEFVEKDKRHFSDILDDFTRICKFFGYSISSIVNLTEVRTLVKIEPIYSESANDLVYEKCYGKIYHVTTKESAEKIMKTGLRTKNGNGSVPYRLFPERIYFVAISPKKQKIETREEIVDASDLYLGAKEKEKGWCIIKADLTGSRINFYRDTVTEDDLICFDENNFAVYTYNNIPPSMLTIIYDSTK